MGMFSRRKLFQMFGAGSAAVVAARLPMPQTASAPMQIDYLAAAQAEFNARRSAEINSKLIKFRRESWEEWVRQGFSRPYQEAPDLPGPNVVVGRDGYLRFTEKP